MAAAQRKVIRLIDMRLLEKQLEHISMGDLRKAPGDVLLQVSLGKTYIITRNGKPAAVLQQLPGGRLMIEVDPHGKVKYQL